MPKRGALINFLIYAGLCLIWSTTWAMIKIGLDGTPPVVGLSLRFLIASLVLLPLVKIRGRRIPMDRASLQLYAIVGFLNMAASYFCTYWGTQYIPSSLSSILWATLPLFVGVFAHFMVRQEPLTPMRIFAILVSTLGVVRILSDQKIVFSFEILLGSIIVIVGVIVAAFPSVYTKTRKFDYDPLVLTAMSIAIAAVVHTVIATLFGEWKLMVWSPKNLLSAAYLGVFGSVFTFLGFYTLLRRIAVVKLSFITFITPIFASLIGWLFLGELITRKEILGIVLIFSGLVLYDWRRWQALFQRRRLRELMGDG